MALEFFQQDLVWLEIRCDGKEGQEVFKKDILALDAFKKWMLVNGVIPVRNPVYGAAEWVGGFTPNDAVDAIKELKRLKANQVIL